jgi:hypothetical protein
VEVADEADYYFKASMIPYEAGEVSAGRAPLQLERLGRSSPLSPSSSTPPLATKENGGSERKSGKRKAASPNGIAPLKFRKK